MSKQVSKPASYENATIESSMEALKIVRGYVNAQWGIANALKKAEDEFEDEKLGDITLALTNKIGFCSSDIAKLEERLSLLSEFLVVYGDTYVLAYNEAKNTDFADLKEIQKAIASERSPDTPKKEKKKKRLSDIRKEKEEAKRAKPNADEIVEEADKMTIGDDDSE
jgi:hypothetical protein